MRYLTLLLCCAFLTFLSPLEAQTLVLGRVIGQNSFVNAKPSLGKYFTANLVEGRELNGPEAVVIDTTSTPSSVYVSDTLNNRILAWKDASAFQNGDFADVVIGQTDFISTAAGTSRINLSAPTGLAIDAQGNLWVMDSGNNRVLRYPKPYGQPGLPKLPDQALGQQDFNHGTANAGGLSASSLRLVTSGPLRAGLAFDGAGNLWVTDSGNHRVLRFPVDTARPGYVQSAADLVLGQQSFTTATSTTVVNKLDQMNLPSGLALDSSGYLYVTDALHRVLVFKPPLATGAAAFMELGGLVQSGAALRPPTAASLNTPESVTIVPSSGEVLVSDTLNNRVLKFPPLALWGQSQGAPVASAVYGQPTYVAYKPGPPASGLNLPVHVAVSASGEYFVADSGNNRVIVYPPNSTTPSRVLGQLGLDYNAPNLIEGRELRVVGGLPISGGSIAIASAMVVDRRSGVTPHLYISDPGNNRVLGYCDGRMAKQGVKADLVIGQPDMFHSMANGDGGTTPNDQYLYLPSGLAIDAHGNLLVADTGNGRVLRFAAPCDQPAGQQSFPHANLVLGQRDFTTHFTGATANTLTAPVGVALTAGEGFLLVSDLADNRVLRFENGGGDFQNGQNAAAIFGQSDPFSNSSGNRPDQLNSPRQIAEDSNGRLYIADFLNNRISIFTDSAHAPTGSTAVTVNTSDDANRGINRPHGIVVDLNDGSIWVAPANENRVLHYPEYQTLVTSPYITGSVPTALSPLSLTLDQAGNLLVAESGGLGTVLLDRVALYYAQAVTLNGASFQLNQPLTPGLIVSTWVKDSVPATPAQSIPLPRELGGLQVFVNDKPAPIFWVGEISPNKTQINYQIPTQLADGTVPDTGIINIQVVEAATGQVLGAGAALMRAAFPAFFMWNTATGQVAAINGDNSTDPNNISCNGPTAPASGSCTGGFRPVKRGEVLILYLTGQGHQSAGPADGTVLAGAAPNDGATRVILGTAFVPDANVQYSGAAPCCVGLWQINVLVPNTNVAPGAANPVAVLYRDVPSSVGGVPKTTVMIQ